MIDTGCLLVCIWHEKSKKTKATYTKFGARDNLEAPRHGYDCGVKKVKGQGRRVRRGCTWVHGWHLSRYKANRAAKQSSNWCRRNRLWPTLLNIAILYWRRRIWIHGVLARNSTPGEQVRVRNTWSAGKRVEETGDREERWNGQPHTLCSLPGNRITTCVSEQCSGVVSDVIYVNRTGMTREGEPVSPPTVGHNAIAWTVHEICTPLLQRACSEHVSPGEFPSGFSTIPIINSNYAQSPKASATLRAFYRHRSSLWPTNCSNNTTSNSNRSNNYKMELLDSLCSHAAHATCLECFSISPKGFWYLLIIQFDHTHCISFSFFNKTLRLRWDADFKPVTTMEQTQRAAHPDTVIIWLLKVRCEL